MPWTEIRKMDARLCFVAACLRGDVSMSEVCAGHGISRRTGYKWLDRYREFGAAGLSDRSSAPLVRPHGLPQAVAAPILALRRARPNWGPRKLLAKLSLEQPGQSWPAASTVGDLLAREGLVAPRKRAKASACAAPVLAAPRAANESWSADFKGWFRTADGVRCEPLTVSDNFSRYLLVSHAVARPTFAEIKPVFVAAFRTHGLPLSLRTDNGNPFANRHALAGLTRFSVWLLTLDIWPDRIAPGRPDQNGRHERMHRTLKQDVTQPREASLASQQRRMDAWRHDFNTARPHEALGQRYPASAYTCSPRSFPESLAAWEYPADHQLRRVNKDGYIVWRDKQIYLSEALVREEVGIARRDDGDWTVRFRAFDLATLSDQDGMLGRSCLARSGQTGTP